MADNMDLKENIPAQEENGIAMELLMEQKKTNHRQWILIVVLIILLAGTNIYHIWQWSQFDTVVVDSGDGGNAGYVGNDGDVNNYGENSGSSEKK